MAGVPCNRSTPGTGQRLTELDSAIGDADHGINMDRGFTAVRRSWRHEACSRHRNPASERGHGAHPQRGRRRRAPVRHFLPAGRAACAGKAELDEAGVVALFQAGIEGVRQRGKAVRGDKTMLDALLPALEAMREVPRPGRQPCGDPSRRRGGGRRGHAGTIPMQARKGRASYLGPRSIGHQDPGATSSCLLVQAAAEHVARHDRPGDRLAQRQARGGRVRAGAAGGAEEGADGGRRGHGDPENPIGTDAFQVLEAIESVYSEDGVLVLMDLGAPC